jgi:glycosyltransferase involved in cell wall biosynthesis
MKMSTISAEHSTPMSYSVVVPAFNAANTIEETIRSALSQTVQPQQVIIVDDGSTDGTADMARRLAKIVRVIRQENAGVGRATTVGLAAVETPLVATLDADDLWLPRKMAMQIEHLRLHAECHGVFTFWQTFGEGQKGGDAGPGWSRTTMLIRTKSALQVGPVIDPEGGRGDMIDWIARARDAGLRLDMIEEVLTLRRIRPGSLSYGRDPVRDRGYARVAWLALQRRKGRGTLE